MEGSEEKQGQHGEYMNVAEIAKLLHVDKRTVRRWIKAGKLPAERQPWGRGGGALLVLRAQVEKWLAEGRQRSTVNPLDSVPRCQALKADGTPCGGLALKGDVVCRQHRGEQLAREIARMQEARLEVMRRQLAAQASARDKAQQA